MHTHMRIHAYTCMHNAHAHTQHTHPNTHTHKLTLPSPQIMALQSALEPHLGRRAVLSMLRVMPSLLNTSSDTLGWHYEEVASMFGAETAASLVVK